MKIITYPHPTLRRPSPPVRRVDADLRLIVRRMFDLMYEAKGIGLAANQVDLPLRLFVVNLEGDPEAGKELVFINPVVSHPKGLAEREEGCLSLPGLYADVKRPEHVRVEAYNLSGEQFQGEVGGLLARVIQHELDHLDGVLFVDRLSETGKLKVREALAEFETEFASRRATGEIPTDDVLAGHWADFEQRYA